LLLIHVFHSLSSLALLSKEKKRDTKINKYIISLNSKKKKRDNQIPKFKNKKESESIARD